MKQVLTQSIEIESGQVELALQKSVNKKKSNTVDLRIRQGLTDTTVRLSREQFDLMEDAIGAVASAFYTLERSRRRSRPTLRRRR